MSLLSKQTVKASARKGGLRVLANDLRKYYLRKEPRTIYTISPWDNRSYTLDERLNAIRKAVDWLLFNQSIHDDHGFGSFYLTSGWLSSYPETSGYIVPTLLDYGRHSGTNLLDAATQCADWLVSIQKPSGGWQGGYLHDNRPEVVFNTGQVIRGLTAVYTETQNTEYLESAIKAADWLCSIQHPHGYWDRHTYLGITRVFDTYVAAPLVELYGLTHDEKYREAAVRQCAWVINERQRPNGWFEDCDNTAHLNSQPITHTIAYTIDGLLDVGRSLQNEAFINAAALSANKLFSIFNTKKYLSARFDSNWRGTADYVCLTGCAQIAIIWLKLFELTENVQYLNAGLKLNDFLISCQCNIDNRDIHGAIPGSFPAWGAYAKFGYPNWATKYFIDSLLLEARLLSQL